MTSGDAAKVSVFVAIPPDDAFAVFTQEIDAWWRHGPKFRIAGRQAGKLCFEGRLGGRLYETFELVEGPRTFVVGEVLAWDPPSRFELEWRNVNFQPGEKTFVEVTFQPQGQGTLVAVRHHGFAALRPGHPARHGLGGGDFSRMIGLWWGELLTSLREHVANRAPA